MISLEPWDEIWRRNQHLTAELVRQRLVDRVIFVNPPIFGRHVAPYEPIPGVVAVTPHLLVPKRLGGLRLAALELRYRWLRNIGVLWVNDPALGVHCLTRQVPALYDVTDDWRSYNFPPRIIARIVRAEDRLARRAATVVCSEVLQERWKARYAVRASLIPNGYDANAFEAARPQVLDGPGPHIGYVGTLQAERLDIGLVGALAHHPEIGTVHLLGPDALDELSRSLLGREPKVRIHPPAPAVDVPGWIKAFDVLICPHLVTEFTLSLDAIKAHEYLASGLPVVATPTSGFQHLAGEGVILATRDAFAGAAVAATKTPRMPPRAPPTNGWDSRAHSFAGVLGRS